WVIVMDTDVPPGYPRATARPVLAIKDIVATRRRSSQEKLGGEGHRPWICPGCAGVRNMTLVESILMTEFHDEQFGFRFTGLTPEMQLRLRAALPNFEIGSRDPAVALVVLDADQDLQPLYAFLDRETLEPSACSVWVSVVTSRD